MNKMEKAGGIAALVGAATNLLALGVFAAVLVPAGFGAERPDPAKIAAFLADHRAFMRAWYQVTYLAFGACMIVLSLALDERLKAGSPAPAQAATAFGLIYAVLVILIGSLQINDLRTVAMMYLEDPARAATAWTTLDSVETGLGAGGGETIVHAAWFILLSLVAARAGALPKALNCLGLVIGAAGILSVVLTSPGPAAFVYALGLMVWFVWLGLVMLRGSPVAGARDHRSLRPD